LTPFTLYILRKELNNSNWYDNYTIYFEVGEKNAQKMLFKGKKGEFRFR
jgi:hypothetical protein